MDNEVLLIALSPPPRVSPVNTAPTGGVCVHTVFNILLYFLLIFFQGVCACVCAHVGVFKQNWNHGTHRDFYFY